MTSTITKHLKRSGASPILVAGVALSLLACTPTTDQGDTPGTRDLLDRLPQSSSVIGWIDFDAVRNSPVSASFLEDEDFMENEDYEELQKIAEETGIDAIQDVHKIAIGVFSGADDDEGAIVANITYDEARLTSALSGRETTSYGGHTLYILDDDMFEEGEEEEGEHEEGEEAEHDEGTEPEEDEEDEDPAYLVILDAETLLFGSEAGVHAALDVEAGDQPSVRANAETTASIDKVAGSDF